VTGRGLVAATALAAVVGAFSAANAPGADAQTAAGTASQTASQTAVASSASQPVILSTSSQVMTIGALDRSQITRLVLKGGVPATPVKTPSLVEATPHGTPVDLHIDAELEDTIRRGEDMILNREYTDAMILFQAIGKSHADSPIGPLGEMLVYQSQMLENGDFAQATEYEAATKVTAKRTADVMGKNPGAWDRMLAGGFYGVRAMHAMRLKKYLKAVDDGWEALSELKTVKKAEPDFADSDVGLGLYDYWRSVITHNVRWLPFFSDKRKQGISEIEHAFIDAQYTRPIAQLVLVFIYIDEHRYDDAIALGEDMGTHYPKNTLVRVQLGRAYSRKGRYADAIVLYKHVLELQPETRSPGITSARTWFMRTRTSTKPRSTCRSSWRMRRGTTGAAGATSGSAIFIRSAERPRPRSTTGRRRSRTIPTTTA
jgi:tetratricopeptide (TPR) repeat protein